MVKQMRIQSLHQYVFILFCIVANFEMEPSHLFFCYFILKNERVNTDVASQKLDLS